MIKQVYENGRLGNRLNGRFIIGCSLFIFSGKGKNGFAATVSDVLCWCCLANCCLSKSNFVELYRDSGSGEVDGDRELSLFISGDVVLLCDSLDNVLLCLISLDSAASLN